MVKKRKNLNNNNDNDEIEDLEKIADLTATQMSFSKADLKRLRIESATEGVSMASVLRGLLRGHFKAENKTREKIEANFYPILEDCKVGWISKSLDLDSFVEKMFEAKIKLSALDDNEWNSVLDSLGNLSSDFEDLDVDGVISKIRCLKPTKEQIKDIRNFLSE